MHPSAGTSSDYRATPADTRGSSRASVARSVPNGRELNDEILKAMNTLRRGKTAEWNRICKEGRPNYSLVNCEFALSKLAKWLPAECRENLDEETWGTINLLLRDIFDKITSMDPGVIQPRTLASIIQACAKLGVNFEKHSHLLDRFVEASIKRMADFEGHHLSTIAWALATLRIRKLALMQAIADAAISSSRIKKLTPHLQATLFWAFSELNVDHPRLCPEISREILRRAADRDADLNIFKASEICRLLNGITRVRMEGGTELVQLLRRQVVSELLPTLTTTEAASLGHRFSAYWSLWFDKDSSASQEQEIACLMQLLRRIVTEGKSRFGDLSIAECTQIASSIHYLNVIGKTELPKDLEPLANHVKSQLANSPLPTPSPMHVEAAAILKRIVRKPKLIRQGWRSGAYVINIVIDKEKKWCIEFDGSVQFLTSGAPTGTKVLRDIYLFEQGWTTIRITHTDWNAATNREAFLRTRVLSQFPGLELVPTRSSSSSSSSSGSSVSEQIATSASSTSPAALINMDLHAKITATMEACKVGDTTAWNRECNENIHIYNVMHCVAALGVLGTTLPFERFTFDAGSWKTINLLLRNIHTKSAAEGIAAREITNLFYACARLGITFAEYPGLLEQLIVISIPQIKDFECQDLGDTTRALARLAIKDRRLLAAIVDAVIVKVGNFSAQELADLGVAFDKLGVDHPPLVAAIMAAIRRKEGEAASNLAVNLQELVIHTTALAHLNITDPDIQTKIIGKMDVIAENVKVKNCNSQVLADLATVFAYFGKNKRYPDLMKEIAREAVLKIEHFKPQELVKLAAAYIELDIHDKVLKTAIARATVSNMEAFNPQELAILSAAISDSLSSSSSSSSSSGSSVWEPTVVSSSSSSSSSSGSSVSGQMTTSSSSSQPERHGTKRGIDAVYGTEGDPDFGSRKR